MALARAERREGTDVGWEREGSGGGLLARLNLQGLEIDEAEASGRGVGRIKAMLVVKLRVPTYTASDVGEIGIAQRRGNTNSSREEDLDADLRVNEVR